MSAIAFPLPEEVVAARDGILAFAKSEVIPAHDRNADMFDDHGKLYDADGRFSQRLQDLIREVRMKSSAAGFYQMCVPEPLGGGGLGMLAYYTAWEAMFHALGPRNWLMLHILSHWAMGPSRLLEKVTETARGRILDPLVRGEKSMCFGLSEPGAGSDVQMLKTRAVAAGNGSDDGWRISGRKIWTTNAPVADYCVVFAITDMEKASARRGGISAFLVPTDSPGFEIQRIIKMFGSVGGDEAEVVLEDVHVEPWQLVGELHQGFDAAKYGVSIGRIYNSARSVGTGRWAIEQALEYAGTRESFGKKIADYQGVAFPLAESATELHAAHLMGINAATLMDQGSLAVKELSMAKGYSVQVGFRAIDRAIQTHGAMGFTNELGLTDAWHAIRVVNIADGTNEILNRTIAQRLMKGDLDL